MSTKHTYTVPVNVRERVVAVVPEFASGPGWSNRIVSVYIVDTSDGRIRTVHLQPDEQSAEMKVLFSVGAEMCEALIAAVPVEAANE